MTKVDKDELTSLVEEGLTQKEIAERLGVSPMTILRTCKKLGLKTQGNKKKIKDYTGVRSGRLVYLQPSGVTQDRRTLWKCQCDCGNIVYKTGAGIGYHQSCGECVIPRNSQPLYKIWRGMHARCKYSGVKSYHRYGGRGIKVCSEWEDYETFKTWALTNGYEEGLSIDRIDNGKGYQADNCRWVSQKQQMRNTDSNRNITYNDQTKCLIEWAEVKGISPDTLAKRLDKYNWSIEKALNTPVRGKR